MGVTIRFHRGAWWIFLHDKRARMSKKVGSHEAAKQLARELREQIARKAFNLQAFVDSLTLGEYADTWIEQASTHLKPSTMKFYRDNLAQHIRPLLGTTVLSTIGRHDVKRLIAALQGKALSSRTVTGVVRTLSTILSEAVEEGRLAANPALRPGRLRRALRDPHQPKREPVDPFTREEAAAIVETARQSSPAWHPFVLTALRTGMRLGELRALRWGDLDWRHRCIHVARNYVLGAYTKPKSGKARRVDMSEQLRSVLRLHRRQLRQIWLAKGKPMPELVFPNDVGRPLDDSKVRRAITGIVRRAEVRPRGRSIHVFRHTFAALLAQQGESLVYIKEQMGHSSITVTADVYAKFAPSGNRSAVDRLDAPARTA